MDALTAPSTQPDAPSCAFSPRRSFHILVPLSLKTFPAIHRQPFSGQKRDHCFNSALSANDTAFNQPLGLAHRSCSLGATFTTVFWNVLEALGCEEELLRRAEQELLGAILTNQRLIFVIHCGLFWEKAFARAWGPCPNFLTHFGPMVEISLRLGSETTSGAG